MIYNDDQWNRHTYTQPHTSPKYKQKCMTHDMTGICREGCFYTSSEGLCCTFFLLSCRNPLISLDSVFSSFLSLPVAPHSGGTLQCHSKWPPSNFWQHRRGQTGAPALSLDSIFFLYRYFVCPCFFLFSTGMFVSFSTTAGIWCHLFSHLFHLFSLCGGF